MKNRPTGIIRTLPSFKSGQVGRLKMERAIALMEKGRDVEIYIALSAQPKVEVLHMYLLIEGRIELRMNISGYLPGDRRECWDGTHRQPKFWAVCTAPVTRPEEPIKRRGFQGFRYTEELW
ncbi:MAG TPA: hypothetical protein VHU19_14365 [Pyrinomonadaceae bacterium]|jgi:hypothetical protein|nr:hypothetical protein [Pyrinomonadaceae bacterium]